MDPFVKESLIPRVLDDSKFILMSSKNVSLKKDDIDILNRSCVYAECVDAIPTAGVEEAGKAAADGGDDLINAFRNIYVNAYYAFNESDGRMTKEEWNGAVLRIAGTSIKNVAGLFIPATGAQSKLVQTTTPIGIIHVPGRFLVLRWLVSTITDGESIDICAESIITGMKDKYCPTSKFQCCNHTTKEVSSDA